MNFGNIRNMTRKIFKFGPYLALSNLILVYGQKFLSPSTIRRVSDNRNRRIQQKLSPILPKNITTQLPQPKIHKENAIWVCWLQGEDKMPSIPKLCVESIRRNANGHEVTLLTLENYHNYVIVPPIIEQRYKSGQLKHAHFADIIRINVLAQQGGLWLDATMLLTAPIDEDIFEVPFFSIKTPEKGYFVSRCRWAVFALGCQRGNSIMSTTAHAFEKYLTETDLFIDYFLFDHFIELIYQTFPDARKMIDDIPYNNPNVHELSRILTHPFDSRTWNRIMADTSMFKLNSRAYASKGLDAADNSFYSYVTHHLND